MEGHNPRELYKLETRVERLEECQGETKQNVAKLPARHELEQIVANHEALAKLVAAHPSEEDLLRKLKDIVRTETEAAYELQKRLLPGIIEECLDNFDRKKRETRKAALEEIGYEIGPDGSPRPKGGALNAFIRKNATMIILFSIFVAFTNVELLGVAVRIAIKAFGLV